MVLYVMSWDLREKKPDYTDWAKGAIQRTLSVPGPVEFRAYRPVTGQFQVVVTYEFADVTTWAKWYENEAVVEVFDELRNYAAKVDAQLWGPSPVVPKPVRPGT